jgi:hypothetical protein
MAGSGFYALSVESGGAKSWVRVHAADGGIVMRVDMEAELRRLEWLADLLDSRFRIPGTEIRIGLDPLIGLVPAVGDGASLLVSAYLVLRARRLGLPRRVLARMVLNLAIDGLVGTVPVLGDIFDIGFKANRRNIALVRRFLTGRNRGDEAMPRPRDSAPPAVRR